MKMYDVYDAEFAAYGSVLTGYDYTDLFDALKKYTCPERGIIYEASVQKLERCHIFNEFQERGFGGMPIEIGYVAGVNDMLNCLEYHKSSEFNIAMDEVVLMLGLQTDIENGSYDTSNVKAFRVPAGTGVELYGTTLHYAPCGLEKDKGFRVACVLPNGTNVGKPSCENMMSDPLCYGRNKWLLAHPDSVEAASGAYVGLAGENYRIEAFEN